MAESGWRNNRLPTSVITMIVVCALAAIVAAGPASGDRPVVVKSSDIPDRIQIIGSLGRPMGTLLTIRGRWERPARRKFNDLRLRVLQADGDPLQKEVCFGIVNPISEFSSSVKRVVPREGEVCELRGFESGGFFGSPPEAALQALKPGEEVSQGSHAGRFSFDTRFEYTAWKSMDLGAVPK